MQRVHCLYVINAIDRIGFGHLLEQHFSLISEFAVYLVLVTDQHGFLTDLAIEMIFEIAI